MMPTHSMNEWPPTPKSIKHNTCIAKQTFLWLRFYMFTCWLFVFTTSLRDVASEFDLNVQELWLAACSVSACMFRFSWGRQRRGRTTSEHINRHQESTYTLLTPSWLALGKHTTANKRTCSDWYGYMNTIMATSVKKQIEHGSNKIHA